MPTGFYVKGAHHANHKTANSALGAFGCYFFLFLCLLTYRVYASLRPPSSSFPGAESGESALAKKALASTLGYVDLGVDESVVKKGAQPMGDIELQTRRIPKMPDAGAGAGAAMS